MREVYLFQWAVGPVETSCILGRNVLQYLHSCKGSSQLHHCTCTTLQNGGVLSGPLAISCAITWALEMFGSKALQTTSWSLPQRSSLYWVMSSVTWDLRRDNSSCMWEHACHVLVSLATPCAITYMHMSGHHTAHVLWDQSLTLALPKHEVVKF